MAVVESEHRTNSKSSWGTMNTFGSKISCFIEVPKGQRKGWSLLSGFLLLAQINSEPRELSLCLSFFLPLIFFITFYLSLIPYGCVRIWRHPDILPANPFLTVVCFSHYTPFVISPWTYSPIFLFYISGSGISKSFSFVFTEKKCVAGHPSEHIQLVYCANFVSPSIAMENIDLSQYYMCHFY